MIVALASSFWFAAAAATQPSIRVQAGDWGAASVRDIEAVLRSVAEVLLPDFPQHAQVRILISPSAAGPRVLAARTVDGEHQVLLNVRDARWDQFAYQFSHELCHIFSNYGERSIGEGRDHQWFEEAVCEAVSIVALQRLAVRWRSRAPHDGWESYAPAFADYAGRVMGERRLAAPAKSFAAWYGENESHMARDPYLRERSGVVAERLIEFLRAEGLQAVGYLNRETHAGQDLGGYLAAWYDCCPEAHRALVRRVIELLRAQNSPAYAGPFQGALP